MGCSLAIKDNVKEAIHKAVNLAYEYGKLISFDPNIRVELGLSKEYLETIKNIASKSKIILSGERELSIIGEVNKEEKIIVIKKGKHGAEAYYKDKVYKVAPIEVEEVDPTGAGDCFDAGFVASILQGYTIEDALKRANIIGALSVTKRGPMEGVVDKKTLDMIR